jgi:ribosome-binding protein aMBF1 (putative translation factor)
MFARPKKGPVIVRAGLLDWLGRATLSQASLADKMIEIPLGQRLHELRDKAVLSLRELSRKVGISSPFLSHIELERRFPSEEILGKLAKALNVSLDDLKQMTTASRSRISNA